MKHVAGGAVLDLVMTGEAARICRADRRTFISWAKKMNILPAAMPEGRALYERKDVDRIAKRIKIERDAKEKS